MNSFDPIIEYKNFEPTPEFIHELQSVLWQLRRQGPSQSSLKMIIEKQGTHFKGHCRISSVVGVFNAESTATRLESLVENIQADMKSKLVEWKNNRKLNFAKSS